MNKYLVLFALFMVVGGCTVAKPQAAQSVCARNTVVDDQACNVIEGWGGNHVVPGLVAATISGGGRVGFPNQVIADMGTISGGLNNQAGELATVGGGSSNVARGFRATISGGARNAANRDSATVGGGFSNLASGAHATVSGGNVNAATEVNATVGGGDGNVASERHSTVGGGTANAASGFIGTIAGGAYNKASAAYTAVGGGLANVASGIQATVGGGAGNVASGYDATIGGGMNNRVMDDYGTVGGGRSNIAGSVNDDPTDGGYATIGGGAGNVASGPFSVVPGGSLNTAAGAFSFAVGRRASIDAAHDGVFLYADSSDSDFHSVSANEFAVRATGGVRFVTAIDGAGKPLVGARLVAGSGSWSTLSDRNAKTGFAPVDGRDILERVMRLPLAAWSYKTQPASIRHVGPMAQDFYSIFGVGEGDGYISSVDADGVTLAAVQGLYQVARDQEAQIRAQQRRIETMEADMAAQQSRLAALEARLSALEQAKRDAAFQPISANLSVGWPMVGLCLLGLTLVRWRRTVN